ncbi:MAG: type II secretion system F family protein [Planctomycetes bacterium]|nr:type II secretion system F family protein [Planctomycetota bacterium]
MNDGLEPFYLELSSLLSAGIGIAEALRILAGRGSGNPSALLLPAVDAGGSLADGMDAHPHTFPASDRTLVRAGEVSGRLDTVVRRLAEARARTRVQRARFRSALLYPLFLLHAGLFLLNVPILFTGGAGSFLSGLFFTFGPLYAAIALGAYTHRQLRDRDRYVDVLRVLPVAGPLLLRVALARAFRTAADLYEAGLPVDRAFMAAAEATGPGALGPALRAAADSMRCGRGIHQSLAENSSLPAPILASIDTGERTGRLFEVLSRAADQCECEADTALRFAAKAVPYAIYLLILAFFAVKILSFWAGYYGRISEL